MLCAGIDLQVRQQLVAQTGLGQHAFDGLLRQLQNDAVRNLRQEQAAAGEQQAAQEPRLRHRGQQVMAFVYLAFFDDGTAFPYLPVLPRDFLLDVYKRQV